MAISDFVMGRGGTAYIEVVPRPGNNNGARVKMMRPRRIYVGGDLERLFAEYLTRLACRAAELGLPVTAGSPLLVNLDSGGRSGRCRGSSSRCRHTTPGDGSA